MLVARLLRGLLSGAARFDPVALGATVALPGPVRRATRVDPTTVLR